jgi:hypothetical protein
MNAASAPAWSTSATEREPDEHSVIEPASAVLLPHRLLNDLALPFPEARRAPGCITPRRSSGATVSRRDLSVAMIAPTIVAT